MRPIALSIVLFACGSGSAPVTAPNASASRWALVVSFGSACCGTDQNARAALDAIVAKHADARTGHVSHDWGKEGEVDECFTLEALSADERAKMLAEVRANVVRELVTIEPDCHAGR